MVLPFSPVPLAKAELEHGTSTAWSGPQPHSFRQCNADDLICSVGRLDLRKSEHRPGKSASCGNGQWRLPYDLRLAKGARRLSELSKTEGQGSERAITVKDYLARRLHVRAFRAERQEHWLALVFSVEVSHRLDA